MSFSATDLDREKSSKIKKSKPSYLDRSRVEGPRKLLRLALPPFDHGNRQQVGIHPGVQLQDLPHLVLGLLARAERRVPLLPQELAGADERRRVLELPSHDVGPLIQAQREVAPGADPVGEVGVPGNEGRKGKKKEKRGREKKKKKNDSEKKMGK